MKTRVIVEAPNAKKVKQIVDGIIAVNPNKPEYGNIQLRTVVPVLNNGFIRTDTRVAFLPGRVEDLQNLIASYDLKAGDDFNEKCYEVKLIHKESTSPMYEGQNPKLNPSTAEIVVDENGAAIYRQTIAVTADSEAKDELVASKKVTAPIASKKETYSHE